jgi:serine/threonine protein kinase
MPSTGLASLQPGTTFADDFRVVRPLSEGGMGAVYVVEQLSTGRQRALKLMRAELVADPRQRARFEQEARIGSRIESEHVVEVVGAGVDRATGVPWLAMELLRGEDLASALKRRGPLAAATTLEILEQLAHAVGAAHAAGIVHRDLKPENIFLAETKRTGARLMVKVLDFGIAKVVEEARTMHTAAVGSPLWMAPEQTARGGQILPQTDIWAIGLIAFHTLTGRFFWRGAEQEGTTMAQLLREIVIDPLPLASQRARELGMAAALPHGFDGWFAHATDRSPPGRFADAAGQFQALKALFEYGATAPAPSVHVVRPQVPTPVTVDDPAAAARGTRAATPETLADAMRLSAYSARPDAPRYPTPAAPPPAMPPPAAWMPAPLARPAAYEPPMTLPRTGPRGVVVLLVVIVLGFIFLLGVAFLFLR